MGNKKSQIKMAIKESNDKLQQQKLLDEIEELEWNCQAKECVEKCEYFLKKYKYCTQVIPSYAHMLQFVDYVKATDIAKQLYDEQPNYYKNTYIYVYLLFDFDCRGRTDIKNIYKHCKTYQGEKDIYFYMTHAITAKQLEKYHKNIEILNKAIVLFPNDKLLARAYHHIAATTVSQQFLNKSIELQPNFDFNYLHKGQYYESQLFDYLKAEQMYQKIIDINPINFQGLFFLAKFYQNRGNIEKTKIYFDKYLSQNIMNPSQIKEYLIWRIQYEKKQVAKDRKKISVDLIKKAYLFEYLNQDNGEIFNQFIIHIKLFSDQQNAVNQIRDLILFYIQMSIQGYFKIESSEGIEEIAKPYFQESNQCLQSIIHLLAYQKHLNHESLFQQNYLIWDLYID